MLFNYQKICSGLLKDLPERQKEVIGRRFGLVSSQPRLQPTHHPRTTPIRETLEAIGKSYGITRERVRQIEADGFLRLRPASQPSGEIQKTFQYFIEQIRAFGDLKKENNLLSVLGGKNSRNQVYFLLTLGQPFERFSENRDFYSLWTIKKESVSLAQKIINSTLNKFEKGKKPFTAIELFESQKIVFSKNLNENKFWSYLEISKRILKGPEGLFGLKDWPEINPRGIKDRAFLVFKKEKRPLHFTEVAAKIEGSCLPQTVHNELIKDPRFVLVGRGIYALKIWGYEEGQVKDIILKVLKETGKPLAKEEIMEKVLKQRLVKENTILLNLNNKKYFSKTTEAKYTVSQPRVRIARASDTY